MKRLFAVFASLLLVLLIASPVLAYLFTAPITVQETIGTAYPMLAIQDTLPTTWLVNHGYIDADARDTAISPVRPHMVSDANLWLVTPLPAYGQVNLNLTTGNTPADMDIVTGHGNGKITILEATALRLGNIFSIEQKGWVDTSAGANKDLVLKTGSFRTYVSAASTITSYFVASATTTTTPTPDGAGTETSVGVLFGAATHWQANLTNDADTSYVQGDFGGNYQRDTYAMTDSGISAGTITNVTVYMVCKGNGDFAKTSMRTHATNYEGAQNALGAGYVTYSTVYTANPFTAAAWTWAEVDAMEVGTSLWLQATAPRCTQVYAIVTYYPVPTVSITPVPSAEYTVKSYCDGTWLMLSLNSDTSWDGIHSNRVASGGASVIVRAAYSTGTVTVVNGDATVEGAGGTAWTANMAGYTFRSADAQYYTVLSVTDADTLELTAVYAGGGLGGQLYNLYPPNWIIAQNNVMPYMEYYKHSVDVGAGLVLIAHYQPAHIVHGTEYSTGTVTVTNADATVTGAGGAAWTSAMNGSIFKSADGLYYIVDTVTGGTTLELTVVYAGGTLAGQLYTMNPRLPDIVTATVQDGAITWGANPAGTTMTISSFSGYGGSFVDTPEDTPLDRLPEVPVTDWYGDHTITKAATLVNPIRPFVTFVSDNTSLTEIQTWRWYGVILLVGSAAGIGKLSRGHQGITAIATGAIIALLIAFDSTIFPLYLAVLSAGLIIGGLVSERSHSI